MSKRRDPPAIGIRAWITPDGELLDCLGLHDDCARDAGYDDQEGAMSAGWIRLNLQGMHVTITLKGLRKCIDALQQGLGELLDFIHPERPVMLEDLASKRDEPIWTDLITAATGTAEDLTGRVATNPQKYPRAVDRLTIWQLPDDMQVLVDDMLEAAAGSESRDLDKTSFTVWEVPTSWFPVPSMKMARGDDRGVEHALAMKGAPTAPVLLWGRYWLDGRHRVWLAHKTGLPFVRYIDLGETGLKPPKTVTGWKIARIKPWR